jgi:hypothetical protein
MRWRFALPTTRRRRNLASAFVGEVSAVMCILEDAASNSGTAPDGTPASIQLPPCTVYRANADQLTIFDSPLPAELAQFYTRVAALDARQRPPACSEEAAASDHDIVKSDPAELEETLRTGELLLRHLRRFVAPGRPASVTRA